MDIGKESINICKKIGDWIVIVRVNILYFKIMYKVVVRKEIEEKIVFFLRFWIVVLIF